MKKFADAYQDAVQKVMNEIHATWGSDLTKADLFDQLPGYKAFIFAVSNLSYQTYNGGIDQWFYNGYGFTGPELMGVLEEVTKDGTKPNLGIILRALEILEGTLDGDWSEANWERCSQEEDQDPWDAPDEFAQWFLRNQRYTFAHTIRKIEQAIEAVNASGLAQISYEGVTANDYNSRELYEIAERQNGASSQILYIDGSSYTFEEFQTWLSDQPENEEADEDPLSDLDSALSELVDLLDDLHNEWDYEYRNGDYNGEGSGPKFTESEIESVEEKITDDVNDDQLWKEVAHAAEMIATEDDLVGIGEEGETGVDEESSEQ